MATIPSGFIERVKQGAAEMVNLINSAPPKDAPTATNKRDRPMAPEPDSPSKRRAVPDTARGVTVDADNTTRPRRLKSRPSMPSAPAPHRRNSYTMAPDEETPAAGALQTKELVVHSEKMPKPAQRVLRSNRLGRADPSPLKKHGLVDVEGVSAVNLDDSPSKNTRRRTADVRGQEAGSTTPGNTIDMQKSKTTQSPATRSKASSNRGSKPSRETHSMGSSARQHVSDFEPVSSADPAVAHDESEHREEEQEQNHAETEEQKDGKKKQQQGTKNKGERVQRKRTNGKDKDEDVTGQPGASARTRDSEMSQSVDTADETAEAQAAMADLMKEKLSQMGEAIKHLGCEEDWSDMLIAAAELNASEIELRSDQGRIAYSWVKRLIGTYHELGNATENDRPLLERKVRSQVKHVVSHCDRLRPVENRRTNSKIVKDMYRRLVPALVLLMGKALAHWHQPSGLDFKGLEELVRILDVAFGVAENARTWKPRPSTLDDEVVQKTREDIYPNLKVISMKYRSELQWQVYHFESERTLDALEDRQRKSLQISKEREEQRIQAIRRKVYSEGTASNTPLRPSEAALSGPETAEMEVVDIDDLGLDNPGIGIDNSRPLLSRERTEEIPGPSPLAWTISETTALLNGLQLFTGRNRFADIMQAYGDKGNELYGFDLDALMLHAIFLKQSMANQLQSDPDGQWDWLKSVSD